MAGSMDERIVSMEFDNKQFEKDVKTSMKTIDDLKESLNFDKTGESFDEFTTKCKKFGKDNVFKSVDDSVSTLKKGITLLGSSASGLISQFAEVTKITAMFDMATAAVNKLKSAVKSFTIAPITQGFGKYETKINSIKTIANATEMAAEDVDKSLDRLNWFTDETSASFDSMVQNIGKFTSVGKGLDESITAMQGIAAWGYHSGASVQEQNRAMYNLSQALGTGSVKLIDWKSIENAGMATKEFKEQAIAAAEAAGTLTRKGDKLFSGKQEVTVENFNSTLAKGWFSSDVLMSTLKEYGSFADKVRKYQEEHPQYSLASEAMDAMDAERLEKQEAIYEKYIDKWSNKSEKSSTQIKEDITKINKITNTKERKKSIKEFAKTVDMSYDEVKKALDDLSDCEETLGEKAFKSSQQAKSFAEAIDATKDAVSTGWMKTFQYIFGGLDKSIELWSDVTEILWDLFAAGAEFRNNAFMHWAEEFNGWADLWNADTESGPLGALRNIMDVIIELKDLLGSSFKNVFFPELAAITGDIFGAEDAKTAAKNGLKTTDQIKNWREGNYMGYKIKQVTSGIREFTAKIRAFFLDADGELTDNAKNIQNVFTTIATAVKYATTVVGDFFGSIFDFISKSGIVQDILKVLSSVATKIREVFERLQNSGFTKKLFGKIGDTFVWFYTTIKNWITQIKEFFEETGIGQAIRDFFKRIEEFFVGGEKDIDEHGNKTESGFFKAFGWVKTVKEWVDNINLKQILYDIKSFIDNFGVLWQIFTGALSGQKVNTKGIKKYKDLPDNLKGIAGTFESVGSKLSGVVKFFTDIWTKFTGWLETSGVLPTLRSWWDGIKTFFSNIGLVWEAFTTGKVADPDKLDDKQKKLVSGVINFAMKLKRAFETVKGWITTAWDWIKEKWGLFTGWLESSGILPKLREWWGKISGFFEEIWASITDGSIFQKIGDFFADLWGKIVGLFGGDSGNGEGGDILAPIRSAWDEVKKFFEDVWTSIGDGSIFQKVGDFFSGLWGNVLGIFGLGDNKEQTVNVNGPSTEVKGNASSKNGSNSEEKKPGFFKRIANAFTNKEGEFDLLQGISTGITKLFGFVGSIDWEGISGNVFRVIVKIINGLDDALGELHIDNIIKIINKITQSLALLMIINLASDVFTTIRAIAKKGKDKSTLEQFSEVMSALGTALLQIGITVALIAASLWVISKIDPNRFDAAKGVLIGIGVFLVGFMLVAYILTRTMGKDANKLAKTFSAIGNMFLYIAISVALMIAAIWLVSNMLGENGQIGDKLLVAMGIVAGILLVMAGVVILIGQFTKKVGTVNIAIGIATFTGIAILLAVCVAAIMLLQNVDPKKAWDVILELSGLLLAITIMLVILSKAVKKFNPKMVVGMIVMAVMLGLVVAALVILKDADGSNLLAIAGSIGIIIGVLVAALVVCSLLGPKVLIGAGVLAGALVILAVGLAAVAAIATGIMNNVLTFMSTLASVSNSAKLVDIDAISKALEALPIISTALNDVVSVDVGPALSLVQAAWDVFTKMKLASFAAKVIDVSQFNRIFGKNGNGGILQSIQTAISSVTDTGWKASALGRSVETLAENLKLIGQAGLTLIQDFDGHTYTEGIETVKTQLGAIQEIANIASSIGTIGEGENAKQIDLTHIAEGIGNIGAALELYNIALDKAYDKFPKDGGAPKTISTESITSALTSVMTAMKDVTFDSGEIANVESWAGLHPAEGGGTLFALGLTNIANAMDTFGQAAENFDSANVDKAIESLGKLADIKAQFETNSPADYKTMMEGVSKWGDGGDFKTAISGMGTAIAEFGNSVKDLPSDSVTNATNALDTLAVIYDKLKAEGSIQSYIKKIDDLTVTETTETSTEDVAKTFGKFAEGISKLGDGLAAFSASLTDKSIGYNQEKVDAAVKVLQNMSTIETELKSLKVDGNWWHDLLFGENGIKKLGANISGLGSELSTFSQELATAGGFDINVDDEQWKNISGVLTFFKDIWVELNNLVASETTYNEEGAIEGYITNKAYTLENLATGLNKIREALVEFNKAMTEVRTAQNSSKDYTLGEWDSSKFENIKSLITFLKDITVELGKAGFKENSFYDLEDFGYDLQQMFNSLDDSKMGEFMSKLQNFSDLTSALKTFSTGDVSSFNAKGVGLAAEMISGFASRLISADASDGKGSLESAFTSLLGAIDKYNTEFNTKGKYAGDNYAAGFGKVENDNPTLLNDVLTKLVNSIGAYEQQFLDKGKQLGNKFVEGFKNEEGWINPHSVFVDSITGTLDAIIEKMDGYLQQYEGKGKSAGQAYASGFNQGLSESGIGSLTPIIAMDSDGNTATASGLTAILSTFGYATSADIATLAERLTTIDAHFEKPIAVDNSQKDIIDGINKVNEKLGDNLKNIKEDVNKLKDDVENMKVYIYPDKLVGEINRRLGYLNNRIP